MMSASPPSSLLRHHHHHILPRFRHSTTQILSIRHNLSAPTSSKPSSSSRPLQGWRRIGGQLGHQRMPFSSFCGRGRKRMFMRPQASVGSAFDSGRRMEQGEVEGEIGNGVSDDHVVGDGGGVETSRLMTLPTVLTLGRVVAVPFLVGTFYMDTWWSATATTSIFIIAAVTDWLDGYLARKMHLGTPFGAFLDPVADKLMVAATLILLCTKPLETLMFSQVPWILAVPSIGIIGREITMSALREWAASQDAKVLEAVAVNNLGKWKTATQMAALTILLATRDASFKGLDGLVATGVILLYISAVLAAWSLAVYMKKIWRILVK